MRSFAVFSVLFQSFFAAAGAPRALPRACGIFPSAASASRLALDTLVGQIAVTDASAIARVEAKNEALPPQDTMTCWAKEATSFMYSTDSSAISVYF